MVRPKYTSVNSSMNNGDVELEDISQRNQEESQNLLMSSFSDLQGFENEIPHGDIVESSSTSALMDESDNRLSDRPLERSNDMIAQHIEENMRRVPLDRINNASSSSTSDQNGNNNESNTPNENNANDDTNSNVDPTSNDGNGSRLQDFLSNNLVSRSITNTIRNAPVIRYLNHNYNPLSNQVHTRPYGASNDGVFGNLSAKPSVSQDAENNTTLPTYDEAASDPTPPYWEASIMAGYEDEIFVDGLPVGNVLNFLWNVVVSVSFQFIGFVITYLLHTSHAAKEGSRAGLGITLINLGYSSIPMNFGSGDIVQEDKFEPNQPNSYDVSSSNTLEGSMDEYTSSLNTNPIGSNDDANSSLSSSPILAYASIALGIFITIKAIIDYHKARRTERSIVQAVSNPAEEV